MYRKAPIIQKTLEKKEPNDFTPMHIHHEEPKQEMTMERQELYSVRMFPGKTAHGSITSNGAEKMMAIVYTKDSTEIRYGASVWVYSGIPLMEYDFDDQQAKLKKQAEVRFNLFPMVLEIPIFACECESCFEKYLVMCVEKFGVRQERSEWTMIHELPSNEHIAAVNLLRKAFQS
jgi:hypothetical protein